MSLFLLAKIIHIISAIFFIGVVSFRTFIIPVLKNTYDDQTYTNIDKITGMRARDIIKVNNIFLIVSGLYLFSFYIDTVNVLLHTKITLGLLLASTFYIVPIIMKKFKYIKWFSPLFHYTFFSLMMLVVILSQMIYT